MKRQPKSWTAEYVEDRIQINSETKCWMWQGAVNSSGYPFGNGYTPMHRAVKTIYDGHVWEKGQIADHKCRVKLCVNPDHIRVTNKAVNTYHAFDAKRGSMSKKRLRVAVYLHDMVPEKLARKMTDAGI